MAQKDKVKELVGRGLDSYHTKSLQQIDRIEKKNKQQNHKISILSNELDNDYLTKTEEGSVISLEHSKEGMIYLDELQGNTLVNYCTDGSKEMTLNGDIDLEGTFVTTTEGVDNGKVDVMCEGNTLVNLKYGQSGSNCTVSCSDNTNNQYFILEENSKLHCKGEVVETARNLGLSWAYYPMGNIRTSLLKPNTTYTVILDNKFDSITRIYLQHGNSSNTVHKSTRKITKDIFTITTKDSFEGIVINDNSTIIYGSMDSTYKGKVDYRIIALLEGDWSENEIPTEFFEGMKSVGQDDENGHKIEILSQNKNLCKSDLVNIGKFINTSGQLVNNETQVGSDFIQVVGGENIVSNLPNNNYFKEFDINKKHIRTIENSSSYTISKQAKYITFNFHHDNPSLWVQQNQVNINYGSTLQTYTEGLFNKKEILLNEPLRGLSNGIKDRFVKIGNKWFIERNRGIREYQEGDLDLTDVITDMTNTEYSLETPIYEPLEINSELICYNDTTHISNNSTIPCNMKIKNSGYNAIIKPSTLYTVVLDTNKSGTIGMNLGGAKGTTTNNVLTLTTSATLTDDSLRLYGKGIKGSKVRLLEGDKTNWIPSYFEGMKSSFEDKFDTTDNTYKMEILSNNRNLFDVSNTSIVEKNSFHNIELGVNNGIKLTSTQDNQGWQFSQLKLTCLKPNTTYTLRCNITKSNPNSKPAIRIFRMLDNSDYGAIIESGSFTFKTPKVGTEYLELLIYTSIDNVLTNQGDVVYFKDIQISEVAGEYVDYKSNKIQFSSIEPLRSVNLRNRYVKDKLILKDGKLVIERNCRKIVLDGTQDLYRHGDQSKDGTSLFGTDDLTPKRPSYHVECDSFGSSGNNLMTDTTFANIEGIGCWSARKNFNIRIKTCRLKEDTGDGMMEYVRENPITIIYPTSEPTYEEIPFELQKIILEGYENGTLFFDTNIPPTSTVTYAGETPIVKSVKLNKTEVLNNTNDINDNIIPYLMDMDYRVVCLELATETQGISMARLFGGVYEMLKRDILSGRLSKEEYGYRLADYFNAGKLTEEQVRELEDLR